MRSAFEIQRRVIIALFLRELKTRFGKYRLGYLWAPLEPVFHLMILISIFSYLRHRIVMMGMPFAVFYIAGIIPWTMFLRIAKGSMGTVDANVGLLNYRPVKLIDTLLARAMLEFTFYVLVGSLILLAVHLTITPVQIDNPLLLCVSFISLTLLSVGLGMILLPIYDVYPESTKFIRVIFYLLYFFSGILWSVKQIPFYLHKYILWNPLLHGVELIRQGFSNSHFAMEVSLWYVLFCALVLNVIGLWLYRYREKALVST